MVTKPVGQARSIDPTGGEIEHETLLVIDGGGDLRAVEDQEGFHGGVADPLVAVNERVVLNQREAQRRGLLSQRRVQRVRYRIRRGADTAPRSSGKRGQRRA